MAKSPIIQTKFEVRHPVYKDAGAPMYFVFAQAAGSWTVSFEGEELGEEIGRGELPYCIFGGPGARLPVVWR